MALLLGALVGLERQVAEGERQGEKDFPGVRTFAFTALLGALAVMLAEQLGPWIAVALFLAGVTFLVLRYRHQIEEREDVGYTTEIASMCTFAVGALAQSGQLLVATVVTVAMVALLRSKRALHRAADLLSPRDMEILVRFLVIALVVYPLLPEGALGAFGEVLRPRDVWRMVVLISGVSFVGYALMRFRGGTASLALTGLLAGLVSSTAAAFAYARAARPRRDALHYEALIALAAAASYLRLLLVLAVVAPALVPRVSIPLVLMSVTALAFVAIRHRPDDAPQVAEQFDNPLALRVPLTFAAIYATVLVLVNSVRESLPESATYVVAAIAALPGGNAATLSLARLAADGRIGHETAALAVVVVAVSTTVAKLAIVLAVGRGPLVPRVGTTLAAIAAIGALCFYWLR